MDDVIEGGLEVWDMPIGGGIINGREYFQHALEKWHQIHHQLEQN